MNNSGIDTDSEEWRRICEARYVMKMSDGKRREYYDGVFEKRKQKGLDDLINEVNRQYRLQREAMEL